MRRRGNGGCGLGVLALVSFVQCQASRKRTMNASLGANFACRRRLEDRTGSRLFSRFYDCLSSLALA